MGKGVKKTVLIVLALVLFVPILPIAVRAQTLQPRLLWEKRLPFKIYDIKMAAESGDVILSSKEARRIILYDRQGKERFHWGPRVDRLPFQVGISKDGNIMAYTTGWTESYIQAKGIDLRKQGGDLRVHYADRKGKEKWTQGIVGAAHLSPNGNFVIVAPAGGEGNGITCLNSSGQVLWVYRNEDIIRGSAGVVFSPDSNYVGVVTGGSYRLLFFNINGNVLWIKDNQIAISSISDNGIYISTSKYFSPLSPEKTHKGKIYDQQGNIILEGSGRITGNGTKVVMFYDSETSILNLPDKAVFKNYPVQVISSGISYTAETSYDGRYLVLVGKRTKILSDNNLFIFDTQTNNSKEIQIGTDPNDLEIYVTKDGKYLLIRTFKENRLFYYQIF